MKPAWDKLMGEFKSSSTSLVADVDCTAAGKPLCDKHGIQGFPTIKYGDAGDMKDYQGGRDYDSLKKFADSNLGPTCGPATLDLCTDAEKAKYEKFMAMSLERVEQKIVATVRQYEKELPMMRKVAAHLKTQKKEL